MSKANAERCLLAQRPYGPLGQFCDLCNWRSRLGMTEAFTSKIPSPRKEAISHALAVSLVSPAFEQNRH
jgi:hypothetical protein